jgi:hypothetical protein
MSEDTRPGVKSKANTKFIERWVRLGERAKPNNG